MRDQKDKPEADYARPTERMFRRSRAAEARRRKAHKGDIRLIVLIMNITVLTALLLVVGMYLAQSGWQF